MPPAPRKFKKPVKNPGAGANKKIQTNGQVDKATRKRKAPEPSERGDSGESEEEDARNGPKSIYLKPKVLSVSADIVREKWRQNQLPQQSKEDIAVVLRDSERLVLAHFKSEKRKLEVQEVTHKAAGNLASKLDKLPIPPISKDFTMDLEKLTARASETMQKVVPLELNIKEFEKELEREQAALEAEERELATLEANAKAEERIRNEKIRTLPKVLRPDLGSPPVDAATNIALQDASSLHEAAAYRPATDKKIAELTIRLQKNMYSMKQNADLFIEADLPVAVQSASAAVQELLLSTGEPTLLDECVRV